MQGTPRVDALTDSFGWRNGETTVTMLTRESQQLRTLARQLERELEVAEAKVIGQAHIEAQRDELVRELDAFKRGPNGDKLHIEPTPMGWTAYYDPEGFCGHGRTQHDAVLELLDATDGAYRIVWDERQELRRELAEAGVREQRLRDLLDAENIGYPKELAGVSGRYLNGNPSGQVSTEPSPAKAGTPDPAVTNEDSGPVGLPPLTPLEGK